MWLRKRSLGQGNVFTPVCLFPWREGLHLGGGGVLHPEGWSALGGGVWHLWAAVCMGVLHPGGV